jgi:hypothetical protein
MQSKFVDVGSSRTFGRDGAILHVNRDSLFGSPELSHTWYNPSLRFLLDSKLFKVHA